MKERLDHLCWISHLPNNTTIKIKIRVKILSSNLPQFTIDPEFISNSLIFI